MSRLALLSLPLGLLLAACSDTTAPTAPPPPDGVTASAAAGEILIKWTARTRATSYNIYRSSTPGLTASTGTKLATVPNTYTDSGAAVYGDSALVLGTTYYYLVTAVNARGESTPSVEVNAMGISPLAITSGAPPAGSVGADYGPFATQWFRCTYIQRSCLSRVPCTDSLCSSLLICPKADASHHCKMSARVFAGYAFQATGGLRPYSWSSYTLPPGLQLGRTTGWITGTPTAAGSYVVTVMLQDSAASGQWANVTDTIVINP